MKKAAAWLLVILFASFVFALTEFQSGFYLNEDTLRLDFPDTTVQYGYVHIVRGGNITVANMTISTGPYRSFELDNASLYYYNDSSYMVGGINSSDFAIDGSVAAHGEALSSKGWVNSTGDPQYNNTVALYGTTSMGFCGNVAHGATRQEIVAYTMSTSNTTFQGTAGAWVYDDGGNKSFRLNFRRGGFNNGVDLVPDSMYYDIAGTNTTVRRQLGWNLWLWNWTGKDVFVYVNNTNVSSNKFVGKDGIDSITLEGREGCTFVDSWFITNNGTDMIYRPSGVSIDFFNDSSTEFNSSHGLVKNNTFFELDTISVFDNAKACSCKGCVNDSTFCRVPIKVEVEDDGEVLLQDFNYGYQFGLDFCQIFTTKTINVTFENEEGTAQTVVYDHYLDYYLADGIKRNISSTGTGHNYSLCIDPPWGTAQADMLINYNSSGNIFEYSTFNTSLDNITDVLTLITQTGTSQVVFSVVDQNDDPIQDAYIKILKFDVGNASYKTTEILRTDDNGQSIGNIVLIDAFYRFIIEYNGIIRLIEPESGNGIRVLTTTKTFRINLEGDDWYDLFDVILGVPSSLTYDEGTNTFSFIWSDPNGDIHQGCLEVTQSNSTGRSTVSHTCITSAASQISSTIPTTAGNRYTATAYFAFDEPFVVHILEKFFKSDFTLIQQKGGLEPLFWGFGLVLGLTLIGIPFPGVAITLMLAGLTLASVLGLIALAPAILVGLVVVFIIIAIKRSP